MKNEDDLPTKAIVAAKNTPPQKKPMTLRSGRVLDPSPLKKHQHRAALAKAVGVTQANGTDARAHITHMIRALVTRQGQVRILIEGQTMEKRHDQRGTLEGS
jgi:hypothetical protein